MKRSTLQFPEGRPTTLRTLSIIVAIVATCVVFPSAANAGTYTQAPNSYTNFTWNTNGWPNGLQINSNNLTIEATGRGVGSIGFVRSPALPSTLNLDSIGFQYNGSNGGGQSAGIARLCYRNNYSGGAIGGCGGGQIMYMGANVSVNSPASGGVSCGSATVNGGCAGVQYELISNIGHTNVLGGYSWYGISASVEDLSSPGVWQPHLGTLLSSYNTPSGRAWNRGTRTVGVFASDYNGSGLSRTQLVVDGSPDASSLFNQSCDYSDPDWVPCADFVGDIATLATTGLADGRHEAQTRGTDAGANIATSTPSVFYVDNTEPTAPEAIDLNDNAAGWSTTNSFHATWTNAAEDLETENQSGIGSVVVDVEPTNGAQTDPAAITIPIGTTVDGVSATKDSIAGLTVPEAGRWTMKLRVIDRAGNQSELAAGPEGASDVDGNPIIGYDPYPPAAPGLQSNGWVSESELLAGYSQEWTQTTPQAGSPICGYAGLVDPSPSAEPGTTINIDGAVSDWELPSSLGEGTHWVHIRSVACNGLASTSVSSTDVKVDRTDPVSFFSGVTSGRWYRDGTVVTIGGTDALSGMMPAVPAQQYFRGAYLDYSINETSPVDKPRGSEAQLPITDEGLKDLRFAAVDVAGNRNEDTVVSFGIDGSNPTGFLNKQDPARPTMLSAPIGDAVSGLETAVIEVRRESGGDWILLPTGLADQSGTAVAGNPKNALASARFPDTALPEGRYNVRVRAYDQAGNALITDRDKNGDPLIVDSATMREYSGLSASLFKAKRICKKKQGVKCVKRARGKVMFTGGSRSLNVAFKRGAVVQGFLVDQQTKGLSREPVEIYTQERGKGEVLAGVTSTKADGSYAFKLRPGVSRTVRVYYPGTETRRDTSASVALGTGAKLTLRVSRKRARTGQTVVFRGTATSFDRAVPASGKIIALQFYAGRRWRPAVAIARTDSKGRFSVKYKFDGKRVKARIVFRVLAPSEDGWGHVTSASPRVTLKLN